MIVDYLERNQARKGGRTLYVRVSAVWMVVVCSFKARHRWRVGDSKGTQHIPLPTQASNKTRNPLSGVNTCRGKAILQIFLT